MRVYLAAKFEHRERLRPVRDQIWALGHEVVSTWLDEVAKLPGMTEDEFRKKLALKDLTEIRLADLFILCTTPPSERAGKEVEFGAALQQFHHKLVWIVGPARNVFHQLADRRFDDWKECLRCLKSIGTE